ncbi:unnamed protein product [Peronospora belbahrii]|uniref:tRNA-intron lyase n=1 Tax=Peronospora belbahrii TaxID=622444 RepID=A0AAU9KP68_9STRA|nr:unnamed protein product [Peronospora belbahrii]CAH0520579.1 unnamed protein product [Peronospora belbahrii]
MVSWKMLAAGGNEVEVTFNTDDVAAWQDFEVKGYGREVVQTLPMSLKVSENMLETLPSIELNTIEITRRRHLSLPEVYYAAAMDGVLLVNEPLQDLWERFKSSSATFTKYFIIYQHFRRLGWIPRSGLNYGAHYTLYRGSAAEYHSEYVVYIQDDGKTSSWNQIQSLTRIAADVKKTVLLCSVTIEQANENVTMGNAVTCNSLANAVSCAKKNSLAIGDSDLTYGAYSFHGIQYTVEAIAIRFWDALTAKEPSSYTFLPQPILPKNLESAKKKKRIKRPKRRFESKARTS